MASLTSEAAALEWREALVNSEQAASRRETPTRAKGVRAFI
jgi:hypothetical protein